MNQILHQMSSIERDITNTNSICDKFSQATDTDDDAKCLIKLIEITKILPPQPNALVSLIKHLEELITDIAVFNIRRDKWADIIIGMRESNSDSRKSVKRVRKHLPKVFRQEIKTQKAKNSRKLISELKI